MKIALAPKTVNIVVRLLAGELPDGHRFPQFVNSGLLARIATLLVVCCIASNCMDP